MNDLNNRELRQQLIQRYLDAGTSVAEEQALVDFYLHTRETLSADEERVRQLVLATSRPADDFNLSEEKAQEFDQIMLATQRKPRRAVLWPWVTAACVAGILAFFLTLPKSGREVPTDQATAQISSPVKEEPQEPQQMETGDVLPDSFLAGVHPMQSTTDNEEEEYDQSDLISVDSLFGVNSRPDPMEEYMVLSENLQRECDEVFQKIDNQK